MVGILVSFWDGLFSGAMFVYRSVPGKPKWPLFWMFFFFNLLFGGLKPRNLRTFTGSRYVYRCYGRMDMFPSISGNLAREDVLEHQKIMESSQPCPHPNRFFIHTDCNQQCTIKLVFLYLCVYKVGPKLVVSRVKFSLLVGVNFRPFMGRK